MPELKNNSQKGSLRNSRFVGILLVYTFLTFFTVFLLVGLWQAFASNPTITTLQNSAFPVSKIPFPAVSFCNLNKISKKRALSLADYIMKMTGESREKILEKIKFLGQLYSGDFNISYKKKLDDFQEILDKLKLRILSVIRMLATPCEDLLHSCFWKGVEVNCGDIFYMRLSYDGYCCSFNYVKNTTEWWMRRGKTLPKLQNGKEGFHNALSVKLNNDLDDYFYTPFPSIGINVHVFIPTDYPDKTSGDLMENIADVGSENFFEVIPTTVKAVKDVMKHPVDKRNCLFEVEQQTQFGLYSQSDCFVDCRVKSMLTLCSCIPFLIPFSNESNVCNLLDLSCLNKYQSKWTSLMPEGLDFPIKENEEGLLCGQTCQPACDGTLYEVVTSSAPLFNPKEANQTLVHVYYRHRFHNLFLQDVVHYWFDSLSGYGGIAGLVMGLSLISIVEGVVYVIKIFVSKW